MAENIAAEFVGSVTEATVKWVGATIKRQFNYLCCFTSNIATLKHEAEALENTTGDLQDQVDNARDNEQIIVPEVETWLRESNEIKDEMNIILAEVPNVGSGCFKLRARFSLSKRAKKETDRMKEHQGLCKFDVISRPRAPPATEAVPLGTTYEFQSRKQIEEDIMTSLRDGDVNMIGICGMGGLGKTTMAKMIMNRALKEHVFEEVVMAVVSQPVDKLKIQVEIGEPLGLKNLKEEASMANRVQMLHARLTEGTKRILLVLDDVWERLVVQELGIPRGSKGCTILLTSRNNDVLSKMDVEKVFGMKILSEEEAWLLFKGRAGICVDDTGLNSIAKEIVKECRGLPIALTTVGSALKDEKNKGIWKDAVRQLRKANPTNIPDYIKDVFNPLKVSYDRLDSEEAKSVFLLCCLFDEDVNIPVEKLTYFCMGLGVFEGGMEEARDWMCTLTKMLKSRSLLLHGYNEDDVRMHDVVRDVCIFIAKDKGYIGGNDCTWISSFLTTFGKRTKLFTNLRLLFLSGNHSEQEEEINKFDNSFVEGIRDLQVLFIENYSSLTSLPHTTQSLRNLKTLVLDSCKELETISVVGELVNLEILVCHNCDSIEELPPEMKRLYRLKLLDLTGCENLERIGGGIISSLVGLEELKMLNSFTKWEAARYSNERENENAMVRELEALTNLRCLEIEIDDPALAAENMRLSSKLERFKIRIAPVQDYHQRLKFLPYLFNKTMSLKLEVGTHVGDWIEMQLLRDAECLQLTGNGANNVDYFAKCQNIRWLSLGECETMKNIGRTSMDDANVFPFLEYMELRSLRELEEILDAPISSHSFHNLKKLELRELPALKQLWKSSSSPVFHKLSSIFIYNCPRLCNLGQFSIAANDCFSKLESLKVGKCEMMEQLFLWNEEGERRTKKIMFPKLKRVELDNLPNLITLCQGIGGIQFPLLMTLRMEECPKLKSMVSSKENNPGGSSNANIDDDYSSHLFCQPHKVSFGSLEKLFTDQNPFCGHEILVSSFKGLTKLEIVGYKDSMSLFTSSIARNFVSLRILSISKCDEMVQVIQEEEEKTVSRGQKTILFPKLQILQLEYLPKLVRFCEWDCDIELSSLSQVIIVNCPVMTNFSSEQHISAIAQIQILHIEECEMMEQVFLWNEENNRRNINTALAFSELTSLSLESLPKLTSLCKGIESFEFPKLTQIQVNDCPLLMDKVFLMNLFSEPDKVKMEIWNNQTYKNAKYLSLEGNAQRNLDVQKVQNIDWVIFKESSRGTKLVNATTMDTLFPYLKVLRLVKLTELEEIWDINGPIPSDSFENLEELRLELLPNLKHLWPGSSSPSQMSVVSIFSMLSSIYIYGCHELCNLFSLSVTAMGSCLLQLEELVIESCDMMEHVFFWNEEDNQSNIHVLKLKVLILDSLPKLTSFCKGTKKIELPLLDRKRISRCPLLENFLSTNWSPDDHDDYIRLFCMPDNKEKIELKLQGNITLGRNKNEECVECMYLEGDGSSSRVAESIRCLTLTECSNMATIATVFPLLKVLTFKECLMGNKLMNMTTIATPFPQLEVLCLVNITELEEIWDIDGPKNLSELRLKSLPALKHLWQITSSPSQMSAISIFNKFSSICIYECHKLSNLFSLPMMSRGSCLLQLETLVIVNCEMMERVFLWDEEENQRSMHIPLVFPKLKVLKLDSLPRLMSFSEGTESFEFPLLVEMTISRCPLLQNLISTDHSPIDHDHDSTHLFCRPDKVSFGSLKVLSTSRNPFCGHEIPASSFNGLVELRIIEYRSCMSLFSSSIARNLLSLRLLDISECEEMVQVIQHEEVEEEKVVNAGDQRTLLFPKLENLALRDLPKLEAFCEWKSDVELPPLIQVVIVRCPKMKNFTSVKDCISKLEILKIEECELMEQVFLWNEEDKQSDTTLVFSELKSLSLKSLPRLSSLCKGIESFEFPQLTQIQVKDCPILLQNLVSINLFSKPNKVKMDKLWNNQPLRNAEYLSLEGDSSRNLDFRKVESMHLLTFRECSTWSKLVNVTTMDALFPQLEVLRLVKLTELEEIWDIDGPIQSHSFENFKELRLEFLPKLKHLWQGSSNPSEMNVGSIFNKLSSLHVYGCHELCNLFSLAVTETDSCLLQLEELVIESCDRMEHVFFLNEGENQSNIIHIPNLKVLILDSLPKLACFCEGIESFEFPSLVQKRISRCPQLKILDSTDWSPDDIHLFCKSENKRKMELKLQGNITLGRNKIQECVEYYMTSEGDGSRSLDLGVANNMRCLTFTEFSMGTKLMNMRTIATVFPLLEVICLVNITELKEIWDSDGHGPKNLNELRLKSLPTLKHLWQVRSRPSQMNVEVISIFNKLSCIYIYGCHQLCSLFPLSMMERGSCLSQLERLEIENCEKMEQVFLWNEENIHVEKFPELKHLSLSFLPKLRNICKAIERIQCPELDKMNIINCPRLESLVYWNKKQTFIFNSLRSSQLERGKGATTALQPHMFKREEKQRKEVEEEQRPTHRRTRTM